MDVQKALASLAELESNWDSYGAAAINGDIISAAQSFVSRLDPGMWPTRVSGMRCGGVQLAWDRGSDDLEMEFKDTDTVNYLECYEGSLSVLDTDLADSLIGRFKERVSQRSNLSGVARKIVDSSWT